MRCGSAEMGTIVRESLVLLLKSTSPEVYCLTCLGQAFPDVPDLEGAVLALVAQGAPIELRPGLCCICRTQRTVVGHQQSSR
ncbi:MAG TPA: hypothetical protein VFL90_11715 [Methylomirabilota bacterium]|nr:hypothetical protein [Methylomirabilota bacterium]